MMTERTPAIDQSNRIHPSAIIHDTALIGKNNYFGHHVYIGPNVEIGDNNRFEAFVSVGTPAEHRNFFDKYGLVKIGSNNTIREFVTINSSTHWMTKMGDRCVMLRGSHLSHDSVLEDDVNISCNVLIGGESTIMKGANIGLGAILHQRSLIGSYAMLGMGTVVTKKIQVSPGTIFVGNPARFLKNNDVGIHRNRIDLETMLGEIKRYETLRRK